MKSSIGAALIGAIALSGIFFSSCAKRDPAAQAAGAQQPAAGAQSGGGAAGQAQGSRPGTQGTRSGGQYAGRRQSIVPVQATIVQMGILTADRTTAGVVNAVTQSNVAAQVAGIVKSVPRSPGDWVKAGDIVVQLDDAQLKLALANAQAALDNAKINLAIGQDNSEQANPKLALQVQSAQSALDSAQKFYDSQKALFDLGGISASALDTAASQLTAAKANLEGAKTALDQNSKSGDQTIAQLRLAVTQSQNQLVQAQLNLQYASIRAPFSGQIAAVNMQAGMYVGLNTPVFTLVTVERQIGFSISPSDAPALPVGKAITFAYSGQSYPIKVSQAPSAPINGVIPMVASVPGSFKLPFGTVGSVAYKVPVASGLLVPLNALDTLENQNFVFKIADSKVSVQNVTILGEAGIMTAVAGLQAGDVVVVNPPPGLIQGSQVQAVMVQANGSAGLAAAPAAQGGPQGQSAPRGAGQGQGSRQGASVPQGAGAKPSGAPQQAAGQP